MASASSSPVSETDLNTLIQSLPACRRCRDCRRGCDTVLPKCRQCAKANVDCIFYDHGKNQNLPRSYIASLVNRLRALSAPVESQGALQPPSSATSASTPQAESVHSDPQRREHYEHHFAYAGNSYRYLGGNACLVRSPRLQQADVASPVSRDDDEWELVWKSTERIHDFILTYLDIMHPLYPIIDPDARFLAREASPDLEPTERFCFNMVCSIACYLSPEANRKKRPDYHWRSSGKLDFHHFASEKYKCLAQMFFNRAMQDFEASTKEPNLATLRAVLLLAVNSLFDPKSGNVYQQIALASRLLFSLQARAHKSDPAHQDVKTLTTLHGVIFCLENEIASTLDRPAYLPEPNGAMSPETFDGSKPSQYLCALYRLQHRFRKGDQSVMSLLPRLDDRSELDPSLRLVLHQTHLLLNPCWGTAWHVLEAVVSTGTIHIFLTPHWVYRAGCVLVENLPHIWQENLIHLYSNALVILELSSTNWPNTGVLKISLVRLMDAMKTKCQPLWAAQGVQLSDVRL